MGCYPLFSCEDWTGLEADLAELTECDLVSLSLVTDPFGVYDPAYLSRCFHDVMIPFKAHYVIDLGLPLDEIAGRRHRKNSRRALKALEIDVQTEATALAEEWTLLYDALIERHNVRGIQAFSHASFVRQLDIPGSTLLRATRNGQTVAAQVYFTQADVAHCHLGAATRLGYEMSAFHALDFYSIGYFADRVRWLNLGGGAGLSVGVDDGLSLYKKGWSTETRTSYFCGRIFDRRRYDEIVTSKGVVSNGYFPAYRQGEFH